MEAGEKLFILPAFERLTIPFSGEQEEELASSLIRNGCREPIITWRGVILDGHKRYRICTMEHIEYDVQQIECDSEDEAMMWVCQYRTERLPQDCQAFRYMLGKWYRLKVQMNRKGKMPKAPSEGTYYERRGNRTSIQMSKEAGVKEWTLERSGMYAAAVDVLSQTEPRLLKAVLAADIYLSQKKALELSRLDEKNRKDGIRKLLKEAKGKKTEAYVIEKRKRMKHTEETRQIPLSIGIKDMPAFDPDMELQGLILTMPTWISAMDRAIRRSDLTIVTDEAKKNLLAALETLKERIRITMEAIS